MSGRECRLLNPARIPVSLWDAGSTALWLPPPLVRAYEVLIRRHDLQALADSRDSDDPPVGGPSQERTDQHFAQAYGGSAARAQLALLDPKGEVTPASDTCLLSLTGNKLTLTDAPCGAGAAAFAFLATIAELRAQNVLPRQPLEVILLGAELSARARQYAGQMLAELREPLERQAVFLEAEFLHWDVTDDLSNTDLIKRMTQASVTHSRRLLVVANFNAFLIREEKRKEAEPQLRELFRHASGAQGAAIWIEPDMNRATGGGGLFSWLRNLIRGGWRRFAREGSDCRAPVPTTSAQFHLPLEPTKTARVGLSVMPIDLERAR